LFSESTFPLSSAFSTPRAPPGLSIQTTRQVTPAIPQTLRRYPRSFVGSCGYEVSLARFALGYNPLEWSPAPVAGLYLPRTSASVPHAGAPLPVSTRRLWNRIESRPRPRHLPRVRTLYEAADSRPAQFSQNDTASSLCWGAAAWARSIAQRILSSAMS
jgi:hypothetical protein